MYDGRTSDNRRNLQAQSETTYQTDYIGGMAETMEAKAKTRSTRGAVFVELMYDDE